MDLREIGDLHICRIPHCYGRGNYYYYNQCYICWNGFACYRCANCSTYAITHFYIDPLDMNNINYENALQIIYVKSVPSCKHDSSKDEVCLVINNEIILELKFSQPIYLYRRIQTNNYLRKELTYNELITYTFKHMSTVSGGYLASLPSDIRNIIGDYCTK
jgi:hypothetical protein